MNVFTVNQRRFFSAHLLNSICAEGGQRLRVFVLSRITADALLLKHTFPHHYNCIIMHLPNEYIDGVSTTLMFDDSMNVNNDDAFFLSWVAARQQNYMDHQ